MRDQTAKLQLQLCEEEYGEGEILMRLDINVQEKVQQLVNII